MQIRIDDLKRNWLEETPRSAAKNPLNPRDKFYEDVFEGSPSTRSNPMGESKDLAEISKYGNEGHRIRLSANPVSTCQGNWWDDLAEIACDSSEGLIAAPKQPMSKQLEQALREYGKTSPHLLIFIEE